MLRLLCALTTFAALFTASVSRGEPPPVEAYGKLPAVELMSLSPSGQRLATIADVGDTRQLLVAKVDGMKAEFTTPVGTAKVREIRWAGDDHLLVILSATTNLNSGTINSGIIFTVLPVDEVVSVISINVITKNSFIVFDDRDDVASSVWNYSMPALVGGHWDGMFGGITATQGTHFLNPTHLYPDLYRVNLENGDIELASLGAIGSRNWLTDSAGQVVARSNYDEVTGQWTVLSGSASGKVLASGQDTFDRGVAVALGRTPETVLIDYPTAQGDAYDAYEEAPLDGGSPIQVSNSAAIDHAVVDPVSNKWIGEVLRGDDPELVLFDLQAEAKIRGARKAFPGEWVRFESWSEDFNRIVVFTSGPDDSGTYWLVNIPTGAADPIGYAYPDVKPTDVGPTRMIDWKAADGLAMRGVLTLPPGREPHNLPLVVIPHGGPVVRDYPDFNWLAQAYVSRGYAVLQPNFRGSSDYGRAFRNAGFGELGGKMETDISDGVAELARQGLVNPSRVCIVGNGFGGYAALAGVTIQRGLYRCAVADAGISDPAAMLMRSRVNGFAQVNAETRLWATFMGAKSPVAPDLDAISPLKHAAQADAPILLIHGKDDTFIPIEQSYAMRDALKAAGKPVEMVEMPNEDHWLSREATRVQMLQAAVAFVEKYDPPDPAPVQAAAAGPAKP